RRKFFRNSNDMVTMAESGERLAAGKKIHILRRDSIPGAYCEHVDEAFAPSRLSPFRPRTLHEPHAARVFPPEAAFLADRAAPGIQRDPPPPAGGEPVRARYRRPRLARNRPLARAAHPRSRAQADRQDRRRAAPSRGGLLRLLRGDQRADQPAPPRGPADRHPQHRGAGAPRAHGADPPRRLTVRAETVGATGGSRAAPILRHNGAMVAEREAGVGRRGIGAALGALIGQRVVSADPALPFAALAAGFAAAPFGVYGADRQGRLRWANAALAEMLGQPVERLIAEAPPLADLLAGPLPAGRPPYDLIGSDADQAAAEIELRRGDGTPLKVFLSQ